MCIDGPIWQQINYRFINITSQNFDVGLWGRIHSHGCQHRWLDSDQTDETPQLFLKILMLCMFTPQWAWCSFRNASPADLLRLLVIRTARADTMQFLWMPWIFQTCCSDISLTVWGIHVFPPPEAVSVCKGKIMHMWPKSRVLWSTNKCLTKNTQADSNRSPGLAPPQTTLLNSFVKASLEKESVLKSAVNAWPSSVSVQGFARLRSCRTVLKVNSTGLRCGA